MSISRMQVRRDEGRCAEVRVQLYSVSLHLSLSPEHVIVEEYICNHGFETYEVGADGGDFLLDLLFCCSGAREDQQRGRQCRSFEHEGGGS